MQRADLALQNKMQLTNGTHAHRRKRGEGVRVIKALLITLLLFVITFAMVSLPVLFGEAGAIVLLAIIFLVIFLSVLFDL